MTRSRWSVRTTTASTPTSRSRCPSLRRGSTEGERRVGERLRERDRKTDKRVETDRDRGKETQRERERQIQKEIERGS